MTLEIDAWAARLAEIDDDPSAAYALIELRGERERTRASVAGGSVNEDGAAQRAALSLAFAIDASSSMRGVRFGLAIEAARAIALSLTGRDQLAVVSFARGGHVEFGPALMTDDARREALARLDRLSISVGTNLAAGLRKAVSALSRSVLPGSTRRVILLTDGAPSVGITDEGRLVELVATTFEAGLETCVLGLGDGIDETLCAALAKAGRGRFHYVSDASGIAAVVLEEIDGARTIALERTSVLIALGPRVEQARVLHHFECRQEGRTIDIAVGAVSSKSPRALLLRVASTPPSAATTLCVASARGFLPGARDTASEVVSDRVAIALDDHTRDDAARRKVAECYIAITTADGIRSAWESADAGELEAAERMLARVEKKRAKLRDAGLLSDRACAALPDLDAVDRAIRGPHAERGEARRTLFSWTHNTAVSLLPREGVPRARDRSDPGDDGSDDESGGKP